MLTDSQLVQLCAVSYDTSTRWDKLWEGNDSNGIWFAIKYIDGVAVGVFRGSTTQLDWWRDFQARLHAIKVHPELGLVHEGFDEGLDELFEKALPYLGQRPYIVGHSLGAARAWLFAGRLVLATNVPTRIAVCGSPRPGCQQLRSLMEPVSKISFKNRTDPVTDVPLTIPPLFPYVKPADFTLIDQHPTAYDILADHHIGLYVEGVKRIEGILE